MSTTKPTPGPWVTYKQEDGLFTIRSRSTGERLTRDLAESDALIFAASLEMLEALEAFVATCPMCNADMDCQSDLCFKARAAIQKARGGQ